jgi:glutamate/tyrosine decarboxylase-like PLP-dependent enzyme
LKQEVNPTLELTAEEMRALGYGVVDLLVEHLATLPEQPVGRTASRAELERRLREPLPEQPTSAEEILSTLRSDVLANTLHVNHPRFFGFIPSPGNFAGAMVEALAHGFNVFAGTWMAGSGALELELVTIEWLRQICGLPPSAGGLFVSGGSMANLTALAVARDRGLSGNPAGALVYYSDQTHSSVDRAFRVLGFQPWQIRKIPADAHYRLAVASLREAVAADRAAGGRPFCVVANVGTTNTGAIDPLPELVEFCRGESLWLHADGAYGAAAALSPRLQPALQGMGQVDSLALDPHKWLFQNFEIGCVLLRDYTWLRDSFAVHPEYLKDTKRSEEEINYCEYGVQLTRSARALKLWATFKLFGAEAFRRAIAHGLDLAEFAEGELRARPGWRIVTPAQMAIVSFRYEKESLSPEQNDALNQRLVGRMIQDGYALLTSTVLLGRTVLRLCTINPRTSEADVRETIARLTKFASE